MLYKQVTLLCGALLLAACSSSDDNSSPTPVNADGVIVAAETLNDFVLDTVIDSGEQGLDPAVIAAAVRDLYPTVSVGGSGVLADGSNISIMSNYLNDKDPAGPDNPVFVAVATKQESGDCFGAAVYGYPLPTTRFETTDLPECSAQAVWAALIAELS